MEIVQIIGIIFAAAVILILAYLYRESALIEGKTEVGVGPFKFSLGSKAQKAADAPEIHRDADEIKQEASGGDVIKDSAPNVS